MKYVPRRCLRSACALCLATVFAARVAAYSPAQWAPDNAAVFVEIPDFRAFLDQWKKTFVYRGSQDPQVRKLTEPLVASLSAKLDELAKDAGLESFEQLKVEPEGGAALILLAPTGGAEASKVEPRFAVVADWGSSSPKLQAVVEKVTAHAVEGGWQKDVQNFDEGSVTSLVPPQPAVPPGTTDPDTPDQDGMGGEDAPDEPRAARQREPHRSVHFALADTFGIFGSDTQLIRDILGRVRKRSPDSLAENERYQVLARELAPMGQLNLYVDQRQLIQSGMGQNEAGRKRLELAGIQNLGPIVATAAFAPTNGVGLEVRGHLPLLGEKIGIAKLAIDNVSNKPLTQPGDVPANTILAWWANYKFETLVSDVYEFTRRMDPEGAEVFKSQLKLPISETQIVDLEKMFNSLTQPLKLLVAMKPPFENKDVSMVLSIGHSSRDNIGQLFTIPTMTQFCQKRDLDGHSVYDLVFPPVGASLALTDQVFALGNTPGINNLVASGSNPPDPAESPDPQFMFAAARAPKEAAQVFYLNLHRLFEAALALHNQARAAAQAGQEKQPSFSMDMTTNLLENLQKIPFDQLDKPEELLRFAPTILSVTTSQPDGLRFHLNVTEPVKP